jgi:hypothetical protein
MGNRSGEEQSTLLAVDAFLAAGQRTVGAVVGGELLKVGQERHRSARMLIRRCQRSSASVQPFCFTLSQRRVGPASYRLASSFVGADGRSLENAEIGSPPTTSENVPSPMATSGGGTACWDWRTS